jgi:ADP-ribosylglycohydrolase
MSSRRTIAIGQESRVRAALWSFFAGDALSAPSHWYYGGLRQIQGDYGPAGIAGYVQPVTKLPGSILNKSDLSGGGRSSGGASSRRAKNANSAVPVPVPAVLPPSIIGHVINHGKQDLWSPSKQIHYHATLHAGETTLEASLARVLMQSIVKTGGVFDKDHFRQAYVEFMMRPGSHNDTYASTCHRMFFANKIYQGRPDDQCPDNDGHNVDTIDGLVLPTITALAVAARAFTTDRDRSSIVKEAETAAKATASVTRRSDVLERAAAAWSRTVVAAVLSHNDNSNNDNNDYSFATALQETATAIGMRRAPTTTGPDQMTACYLDSAMPALLDSVAKYTLKAGTGNNRQQTPAVSVKTALLNNANAGGENVHRGSCLGAVLGAHAGMEHMPPELVTGLYHHDQLAAEIDEFVAAVLRSNNKEDGKTQ